MIEHGEAQAAEIAALLAADGWHAVAHYRDLTGRDRAMTARRRGSTLGDVSRGIPNRS